MDASKFSDKKTGELVKVSFLLEDRTDWAFIPQQLPSAWSPSRKLIGLAGDAMAAVSELNGVCGTFLPNPELLLHPLQTREALTSSKIEGTYISAEQFLLFGERMGDTASQGEPRNADWVEVQNYGAALRWALAQMSDLPVSGRLIKGMHKRLLAGVRGEAKTPGEYRRHQVQVGSTARYVPPPAAQIDGLMANLEMYANGEVQDRLAGLIRCFEAHYQFEAIHPFSDGNGRVGRALLALMVCDAMKLSMPWLYMSAYFERFKDEYIDKLFAVSCRGDWDGWIEFCLHGAIWQAKDAMHRCRSFKRIMDSYHGRISDPTTRTFRIIDRLLKDPFITMPIIQREFAVTSPTARRDVEKLMAAEILFRMDEFRNPQVFVARELFRAAYLDRDAGDDPTALGEAPVPAG